MSSENAQPRPQQFLLFENEEPVAAAAALSTPPSGLQLADLVARPIGMQVLRPTQENRAFDVLKTKFYCSGGRENVGRGFENWGLKIYPAQESEKPR